MKTRIQKTLKNRRCNAVKTTNDPLRRLVLFYEREFYVFSSFSSFAVEWRGEVWPTAEHAYQSAKFSDAAIKEKIKNARSAHDAKQIARAHENVKRIDWSEAKLFIMEEIVRAKLSQHPYIQEKLFLTGERKIIEDSHKDAFWGWGPNKDGKNHLGKIWMKLREETGSVTLKI
ncbi:MAG: NADAR family protein [Candidatus Azambacteria bacterium]|nr:NADAR family protein [Candidatus Azambacteria bacterium]